MNNESRKDYPKQRKKINLPNRFSYCSGNMQDKTTYYIRQFTIADKEIYKQIRLESLQREPAVFGSSYKREVAFEETEWENRLNNPNSGSFGLYYGDILIGTTGILIPQPGTALLIASYIRKEHRGKGLSRLLYQTRIDWARNQGIKSIVVSHRKSNLLSRAANQHFGFRYTHEEMTTWPDGQEEENVYYCLEL